MKPVVVYTVSSRRGVHVSTIRYEEAVAAATRVHRRIRALPVIWDAVRTPVDHTKDAA